MTEAKGSPPRPAAPPQRVRLFPLPDHVLLPDLPTPYRVFEPRYRQLVVDLLALDEQDRWIAIPRLAEGWKDDYEGSPAFEPIAALARVTAISPLPEGNYEIIAQALHRARLTELPSERLYRVADVELVPDLNGLLGREALESRLETIVQLIAALSAFLEDHHDELALALGPAPNLEARVYRFGSVFLPNADWRQRFLETRRLDVRLALLEDVLAATVALAQGALKSDLPPS